MTLKITLNNMNSIQRKWNAVLVWFLLLTEQNQAEQKRLKVQGTCCYGRGLRLKYQNRCCGMQLSFVPVPGILSCLLVLLGTSNHLYTYTNVGKANTDTHFEITESSKHLNQQAIEKDLLN